MMLYIAVEREYFEAHRDTGFAEVGSWPVPDASGEIVWRAGILLVADRDQAGTPIPPELRNPASAMKAPPGFFSRLPAMTIIALDIPEERVLPFEGHWKDGKRRFVVPADLINEYLPLLHRVN